LAMNPNERHFRPAKTVLLTGAGFTKPFGGFLADEMWAMILNQPEIRQYPKLREHMLEELNYETLYDKVLTSDNYTSDEKRAFRVAIRNAYQRMNEDICQDDVWHRSSASGVCRSFVARFAGSGQERGFFFTLNHDLFIERSYTNEKVELMITIPGLPQKPKWFNGQLGSKLDSDDRVRLPQRERVEQEKERFWAKSSERFMYIKLHGSYGWETTKDGTDCMVIGHVKTGIIENEPLLKWYLSLFEEVLHAEERNLVVTGYGFRDPHINKLIANAIRDTGLRLHVVSTMLPRDFKERLLPVHAVSAESTQWDNFSEEDKDRDVLWKALSGYYPASMIDFYDEKTGNLTPRGRAFFRDLGLN